LHGSARLPRDHPLDGQLDVRVHGDRLELNGTRIENADLTLAGGPVNYRARLDLHERGRVALQATRNGDRLTAHGGGSVRVGKERMAFTLTDLECRGDCESMQSGQLRVEHAGATLRLTGRFAPSAVSHLSLDLDAPDLQRVSAPWVDPPLEGDAELHATLDGTLAHPKIAAELRGQLAHFSMLNDVTLAKATPRTRPSPRPTWCSTTSARARCPTRCRARTW
jgi:autotransporter translocation and assembly factor TamB